MYYRVAIQENPSSRWQWKSTVLSSLGTVFQWLRFYRALPHDRLRIFSCSSREELNEQLVCENLGLGSTSLKAAQFLQAKRITSLEVEQEVSIQNSGWNEHKTAIAVVIRPLPGESERADERGLTTLEKRRRELERGAGGDHDVPYRFALPASMPQIITWIGLLAKVHRGEIQM